MDRCRALTTRFSQPKRDIDPWEKQLISLVSGLYDGRLRFGRDTDEYYSITAPKDGRPDDSPSDTLPHNHTRPLAPPNKGDWN